MLFVEYPKCTTCQKAKKWLEENEDYEMEVVFYCFDNRSMRCYRMEMENL